MKKIVVLCLTVILSIGFVLAETDFVLIEVEPLGFVMVPAPTVKQAASENNPMPRGKRARWNANQRGIAQAQRTADEAMAQITEINKALVEIKEIQRNLSHNQRRMQVALHAVSPTRLEETDIQLAYLTEAFRDLYSRVVSIQLIPIIQQTQRTPTRPTGFTVSDATAKLGGDEFAVYSRGLEAFRKKFYPESRQVLRHMIQSFPKGNFSDRAYYWIAESYLMEQKYAEALTYYQRVLGIAGSPKEDNAQFRIAHTYQLMGDLDMAFNEYRRLIHRYPASEFVVIANEAILEIVMLRNMRALGGTEQQQPAAPAAVVAPAPAVVAPVPAAVPAAEDTTTITPTEE